MKEKYIQYKELLKRERDLNLLESQGFKFLYRRNKFKIYCGIGCLIIGVIPNGCGFIAYPMGFYLLSINKIDLFRYKEIGLRKFKRWLK